MVSLFYVGSVYGTGSDKDNDLSSAPDEIIYEGEGCI